MLLKIDQLNVFYGGIHALNDVSLEVNKGEIIAMIGANGAGKSTLLRAISGLVSAKSGTIMFDGKTIKGLPSHEIVRLGIAHGPEGRRVFAELSVRQNLLLGAFLRQDKEGILQDLQFVYTLFPRLKERETQLAGTLSGGEQQMLCIARAVMSKPQLLLLDEPSMGIAPVLVQEIYREIRRLADRMTVLLVEQNALQALRTADRAYVLETGRIVMTGDSLSLRRDPAVKKAYLGA